MARKEPMVNASSKPDAVATAYNRILDLIASDAYQAGEWLREQSVAESLGVSRTPVRQALTRLGAEGVVTLHPGRGAQVVAWSDQEIHEVLTVRAELESQATRLAAARIETGALTALQGLHDEMCQIVQEGQSLENVVGLNTEFHLTVARSCGNRHLVSAVESGLRPVMSARTFRRYSPSGLQRSMANHGEILQALRWGDSDWASALMRAHIFAGRHAHLGS